MRACVCVCVWLEIEIFAFDTAVVELSIGCVGMGGLIGGGVLDASCVCFPSVFAYTLHTSEEDPHVHQQLTDTRTCTHTHINPAIVWVGAFLRVYLLATSR